MSSPPTLFMGYGSLDLIRLGGRCLGGKYHAFTCVHIVAGARLLLLLLSAYRPCSCTHPYRTRPAIRKLSSDDLYTQWCIAKNGGGYTQRGMAKGLKVHCLFLIT